MNMQKRLIVTSMALFVLTFEALVLAADWPMFRGPGGRSVAEGDGPPLQWSVGDGLNVAWRLDLPGRGVSGPIVVSGKVIVTASSGANRDRLHILAFEAETGEKLWHRQFWATGRTLCHETSAVAAPTPASDGNHIVAYFSSNDVFCFDLEGNLLWMRALSLDYPGAGNDIGLSSSPVIADDSVVVQCEAQGNSFVVGLDVGSGATLWDLERPEKSNWASPIGISSTSGSSSHSSVLLQSAQSLSSHRADTGEVIWEIPLECSTIPSSVFDQLLLVPAGGLRVLDVSKQLLSGDGLVWEENKLKPGSPSPVVVKDQVLVINSAGVLVCGSLETGKILWRKRLGGSFWATPVAAEDSLYCINAVGQSFVVKLGDSGEIVSESDFGEDILASPAIADGALFVRSHQHLWKIAD